jgi:hypothetical protein
MPTQNASGSHLLFRKRNAVLGDKAAALHILRHSIDRGFFALRTSFPIRCGTTFVASLSSGL